MYKHANGPPSRLARIAGDKRCSKELEEGPHGASPVGSGAIARSRRVHLSLGSFGLRVSHVLRAHLNSVARGGRGSRASGAYLSRVSVGESTRSSLRRIELESSLHSKEEESSSVKSASCVATTAGPTPAAGEDSARRIRARVSYFENSLQKSKGCDWLREASASIRQAGVHGGLAEPITFANAAWYRSGETAQ